MGDIRTSPRSVRLLRFLKRKPAPAKLLGETEDGEEIECVISGTGPATYTDAVGVLRDCVKVKAQDEKGRTLRVCTLDPDDPELRAETETEQALRGISKHGSVPIISVDLPKLVDNIARNMREVAVDAARQNAAAHKEGFAAMVSVVNIALTLLVGVEQRLAHAEDALHNVGNAGNDPDAQRTQLAQLALQKVMGGNGGGNGGGSWDPAKMMQLVQMLQNSNATGDGNADG